MQPEKTTPKALFTDPKSAKRVQRAEALRRRALSPVRILLMVLMLPLTTGIIALSVWLRTSEFERDEAVLHLVALAGCGAALSVLPGPFLEGEPGYHLQNDPDQDGVACGVIAPNAEQSAAPQKRVGNAKFVRP
ncbi:excalibur calcium-binding domain-containing protein [Ruegeria faecimaris]|uniref:Excalibur calcium-binding domain-containing protein n=1 Tax=Ruegeria faecimaris TaxID=686389 RepID=A0A521C9E3_9RHOB|nr:excalibur calcium-binding domain-containing protein [Ruegeria faecimaris]SMO55994.1 hypothetical protein SAMN06265380_102255 [Ruegeria faecimaris]